MKRRTLTTRLLSLALSLVMALSMMPAVSASSSAGMGNFKKIRDYPGFSDVAESAWYAKDVRKAYELGMVNGKSDGTFDPEGNLTLAEAITMAVNVSSIYDNVGFKAGGTPWYQNAVNAALEWNIILDGQYSNYNALATRADVARMFANALPATEFGRINRIAWIPDVTYQIFNWTYIYVLYNAGIVTGDDAGLFRPDDNISRAEAAAIINRVALPGERRQISLTTHAPGQVVTAADGSFQISVPTTEGWKVEENYITDYDSGFFSCMLGDGTCYFTVETYDKRNVNVTLRQAAEQLRDGDVKNGCTLENDIDGRWVRGMLGEYYYISGLKLNGVSYDEEDYFVETGKYIVNIRLKWNDDCTQEQYDELNALLLGFDLVI